jgi:hypothetical protein
LSGHKYQDRELSAIPMQEILLIDTCWSVSMGLNAVDTIRGAEFQSRHLLYALKYGDSTRIARALACEVSYSAIGGSRATRRTNKLMQIAWQLAERVNNPHTIAQATLAAGVAAGFLGEWRKARELTDRAEKILRENCIGVTWELVTAQRSSLTFLLFLGEAREMAYRLPLLLKEAQERGDRYAAANLRTRFAANGCWLNDEPEKARLDIKEVMAHWPQQQFYVQHYWQLIGETEIELYCGNGEAAYQGVLDRWRALKKSLLMYVQFAHLESLHLRARSALAAAAMAKENSRAQELLNIAERDAAKIEREKMAWNYGLIGLIRAAICAQRGNQEKALEQLLTAERALQAADMALYAAAARRRRGQLLGGQEGAALIAETDRWMSEQLIKCPDRITDMLAPGRWREQGSKIRGISANLIPYALKSRRDD